MKPFSPSSVPSSQAESPAHHATENSQEGMTHSIQLNPEQGFASIKDLMFGSRGAAVAHEQGEINKWRKRNGKSSIPVDGKFEESMESAFLDFQKQHGLDATGIIDSQTRDRLGLENDPNFIKLSDENKKVIRDQMNRYAQDPVARACVKTIVSDPMIEGLDSRRLKLCTELGQNSNFKKLDLSIKRYALELGCNPKYGQAIQELVKQPAFQQLSPEDQKKTLNSLATNFGVRAPMQNPK